MFVRASALLGNFPVIKSKDAFFPRSISLQLLPDTIRNQSIFQKMYTYVYTFSEIHVSIPESVFAILCGTNLNYYIIGSAVTYE
jgi:hypothetical protein